MKATLIKRIDNGWPVFSLRREDGRMIATSRFPFDEPTKMIARSNGIELQVLSSQNRDELLGIFDADKISKQEAEKLHDKSKHDDWDVYDSLVHEDAETIKIGFNRAMKLTETKRFSLKDMVDCWDAALKFQETRVTLVEFLESLRQIEVEVETEDITLPFGANEFEIKTKLKLDDNGFVILKKIEQ